MCYTCILISRDRIGKLGFSFIASALAENIRANPDGYALRFGNNVIRTLNPQELVGYFLAKRQGFENSKIVHLHLRKATMGEVSQDNIHLWYNNGWYFSQNGSAMGGSKKVSDSKAFFDSLKEIDIPTVKDAIEKRGIWGLYLFSSSNRVIIASQNKPVNIYLLPNQTLAFSSDSVNLSSVVRLPLVQIKKFLCFTFEENRTKTLRNLAVPSKVMKAKKSNFILELDTNFNYIFDELPITYKYFKYDDDSYSKPIEWYNDLY